jgi:RHS repeat-associated protein
MLIQPPTWQDSSHEPSRRPTCPASPPGASGIGGPAPYQQQLTYDSAGAGNITENDLTYPGGNTSDTAVSYPAAGAAQPHAATSATDTVNGTAATTTDTYLASGQVHTTSGNGPSQTFTWNDAGQLSAESDSTGGTVNYRYDASGNLLLRQDNTVSTLYLPGEELAASGATVTATRYYTHGGQVIAARTPSGVSWVAGDPHGTDTLAIDASTQAVTQRWYTPFGAPRGTAPTSWPGDRGFVGGTTDPATGLTNLGAREYNPLAQVFISADPLQKPYDPQDLNPYAYAEGNPATNSDPTGLSLPGAGGGHDPCGVDQENCGPGAGHHVQGPQPRCGVTYQCSGTGTQTGPGNPAGSHGHLVKHGQASLAAFTASELAQLRARLAYLEKLLAIARLAAALKGQPCSGTLLNRGACPINVVSVQLGLLQSNISWKDIAAQAVMMVIPGDLGDLADAAGSAAEQAGGAWTR